MSEVNKAIRLASAARELNVGTNTITEFLRKKGFEIDNKPTTKLTEEMYDVLLDEFRQEKALKEKADQISLGQKRENVEIGDKKEGPAPGKKKEEEVLIKGMNAKPDVEEEKEKDEFRETEKKKLSGPSVVGKVDLGSMNLKSRPDKKAKEEEKKKPEEAKQEEPSKPKQEKKEEPKEEFIKTEREKLEGPKIIGKIDIPKEEERKKPVASSSGPVEKKRKRKRIRKKEDFKPGGGARKDFGRDRDKKGGKKDEQEEISEKDIQEKIKATMARLEGGGGGSTRSKKRRSARREKEAEHEHEETAQETGKIQVSEFVTVSELASLMNVPFTEVIQTCMNLGIIVSVNQRLDAEVIELVADEFGFDVQFVDVKEQETIVEEEEDHPEELLPRAPIVTVMGHVDHGKTSLLDYVREANVVAGEQGGITQHIGAYEVTRKDGRELTFLDTPGHEAFTAMRARGAKVTDVAVIVIAADDNVMPQTKEAISHAQAANVPIVFAINKVDKEGANPEKIKEELAGMNLLVEDWGGKYQSQDISAKTGKGVDELLEKVLLEAELLDLKANPNKRAKGSVVEATLDKGRGYVTTVLIQEGTLRIGDPIVAGAFNGKVKAMYDERNNRVKEAGPATPVLILGLDGAPQAGDILRATHTEQEAKEIANKRQQIIREQGLRTKKHVTLDEIGRRLALGSFQELNLIIKGDVDGSVEALSDSLIKLSTEEIQVNIVHKGVGQVTESDVLLASASDAIIVGFQVRPSASARKLAESENIEIRTYSIIYAAVEEIKSAMEGMLKPKVEEKIVCNIEVRDVFKISKIGTIAGCFVQDGKITRNTKIRLVREGVVIYTGEIESLKRHKDDVREVTAGMECGISIKNFNDLKVGDHIEGFEQVEVERKLA